MKQKVKQNGQLDLSSVGIADVQGISKGIAKHPCSMLDVIQLITMR